MASELPPVQPLTIKNVFGRTLVKIVDGKGTFSYLNEWDWRVAKRYARGIIIGLCAYGETKIEEIKKKYKLEEAYWTIWVELKVPAPIINATEKRKLEIDHKFMSFRRDCSPEYTEVECVFS